MKKDKASKHIGIYKNGNKWVSSIYENGIKKYLGIYNTEEDAYVLTNEKAKNLFRHDDI